MTDDRQSTRALALRRWRWHLVLLVLLIAEMAMATLAHRDNAQLIETFEGGSPSERVWALFVLTNRDEPTLPPGVTADGLLGSDERLLREWALTPNFSRFGTPKLRHRHVTRLQDRSEATVSRFLLNSRPGNRRWIRLAELDDVLRELDEQEVAFGDSKSEVGGTRPTGLHGCACLQLLGTHAAPGMPPIPSPCQG